jgi:UDP-2,3-diacylglucosamine pyrophosphatase LpxH
VRFCEWFYISNGDTFIEHGNQQDPYCLCLDPLAPFILRYNKIEIRLPFGNLASRYMVNGMGFINPHVDSSFVMSAGEYIKFFFIYMLRAQPFVIWTWFWGAFLTLTKSIGDTLTPSLRDPLRAEDIIEAAAMKANATPRMVRELRGLFARPATTRPIIVARELWLDRAFIILIALILIFEFVLHTKLVYDVSFFFMVIPVIVFIPFFLFYSRTIQSNVTQYKEPRDDILAMTGAITHTSRIVHGHTHLVRHEIIGAIEHLNPGCWSPSFLDVECTKPIGHKSFVWIQPSPEGARVARVFHFHASSDAAKGSRRSLARGKTKN